MLDILSIRSFCLSLPEVTEDTPFGPDVVVFRVARKMFALLFLGEESQHLSFKADPEWTVYLRDAHSEILPAYHMNKKHWSQFAMGSTLSEEWAQRLIRHSYYCVVQGLPKKTLAEHPDMDRIVEIPRYDVL